MTTDNNPEKSPQEEFSIGDLLRNEREKKGISKSSLAETIKVRENVIDALENEEWEKLPARVFVKGFIRSYAISIGYDTTSALRLFDMSLPRGKEDSPVPLSGRKKKSPAIYYYVVPILIIVAIAVYLFAVRDKAPNDIESDQAVSETSLASTVVSPEESLSVQEEAAETEIPEEVEDTDIRKTKIPETAHPDPGRNVILQEEQQTGQKENSEKADMENNSEEKSPVTFLREESYEGEESAATYPGEENIRTGEPGEAVYGEETPAPETVSNEAPAALLTLSAAVNMRTYVRVIADDNEPKEYIFQPGSRPDWKAVRGFEVKVGNAAGIEFEFNGEKIENIGDMGKVKTLRFPKDFKTSWKEE